MRYEKLKPVDAEKLNCGDIIYVSNFEPIDKIILKREFVGRTPHGTWIVKSELDPRQQNVLDEYKYAYRRINRPNLWMGDPIFVSDVDVRNGGGFSSIFYGWFDSGDCVRAGEWYSGILHTVKWKFYRLPTKIELESAGLEPEQIDHLMKRWGTE